MSRTRAMELLLQPSSLASLPSSSPRNVLIPKHPFLSDQNSVAFSSVKRCPNARKLKFTHFRAQASESLQASGKSAAGTADAVDQEIPSKDVNLAFVTGATGKVGSRTVRELLKLGFRVRAGIRSAQRAESLVESVKQLKFEDGASAVEKLEIVECDLEHDRIGPAIANASVVICCIGASEKEVFDFTGPYRIDYQATKNLIDAATVARVNHFILLTSLGTNKIGFPAAILNLFWGVLIWKRSAEEALIASGLPYTIVRPGGMERPTDAYKETHNISLAKEDTLFGGQVSNLQVAELMAFMTKNLDLSYCKVVEVIAETTAPLRPIEELLSKIPSQRVDNSSLKDSQTASVVNAASSVTEKKPTKTNIPIMRPSSYILNEDLKPPTLTPTTSTSRAATEDVNTQEVEVKPVLSYTQDSSTEPAISASLKEVIRKDIQNLGTLSPYAAYDDLKPPSSPTPAAPGSTNGKLNVVQAVSEPTIAASQINASGVTTTATEPTSPPPKAKISRPLSPYFVYEDLKPPSSPIPSYNTQKIGLVTAAKPEIESVPSSPGSKTTTQMTSYLSPYPVYDDLKPPASPSPCVRTVMPISASTKLSPKQDTISESKSQPLSPFSMYEDLKPPSSPIPSPRKC